MKHDFGGYATAHDIVCTDGRTIRHSAFADQDGETVPLVFEHLRGIPENIIGYAVLEHRDKGVYAKAYLNETPTAKTCKELIRHGDIKRLSIFADKLIQAGLEVLGGKIREVSIVQHGANPGAYIDNLNFAHSDGTSTISAEEAIISMGTDIELEHSDKTAEVAGTVIEHADDKTVKDVFDTLDEEQKNVVYFMIGQALESAGAEHSDITDNPDDSVTHSTTEGNTGMARNVFEGSDTSTATTKLTHSQIKAILTDAEKCGSLKESFLEHAGTYGIDNIELLFPDAKALSNSPELISRRMEWVTQVINGTRKSPFSRIKSLSADITLDTARAKGFVKGNMKKDEFFGLAGRETLPFTIYKRQKLDRDDIIDITDLDIVAWLKAEMRIMLDEEIARAILVGDGREVDDEDKINESKIRPIAHDHDFYAHKVTVPAEVSGDGFIEAILRNRVNYKGTGNPHMFCVEELLTDLLLLKDKMGRRLYNSEAELATACRVSGITAVPVMEGLTTDGGELMAVLVNLSDYTVGSDKGGQVSMFDDFDIDFNQYKYLMEGRMSGCLTKHKTALVFSRAAGIRVTPTVPTFVPATGVVTIPTVTGVVYKNQDTSATLTAGAQSAIAAGATISVVAVPATGYYFPHNIDADWDFTRPTV